MRPHPAGPSGLRALRQLVRHTNTLSMSARVLFDDICDLAERDGVCVKRPVSFAQTYAVREETVEKWLKELRDLTVIRSVPLPHDGRRRGYQPVWPSGSTGDDIEAPNPELSTDTPQKTGGISEGVSQNTPRKTGGDSAKYPVENAGEIPREKPGAPRVYPPLEGGREARARTREADTWKRPSLDEVLERARMAGVTDEIATAFWRHYEAQDWKTSGGMPVIKWEIKLMGWNASQPRYDRSSASSPYGPADSVTLDAIPDLGDA